MSNTINNTNYELNYEMEYEELQAIQSREIEDEYYSDYYGSEEYSHMQNMKELDSQGLFEGEIDFVLEYEDYAQMEELEALDNKQEYIVIKDIEEYNHDIKLVANLYLYNHISLDIALKELELFVNIIGEKELIEYYKEGAKYYTTESTILELLVLLEQERLKEQLENF